MKEILIATIIAVTVCCATINLNQTPKPEQKPKDIMSELVLDVGRETAFKLLAQHTSHLEMEFWMAQYKCSMFIVEYDCDENFSMEIE